MTRFATFTALCIALGAPALPALAEGHGSSGATIFAFDGSFEDAAFALENAIVGKGLVIDHVSHVGEMLARTAADVGSDVMLFDEADAYTFCSAVVSRQVMEADPMNIAHCPYSIFVASQEGEVTIGFRTMPDGPMQAVQTLLTEIAEEAVRN